LTVFLAILAFGISTDLYRYIAPPVESATVARCKTFVAGTTLTAADMNCIDTRVLTDYNGNITNANISASAGITPSKITGTSAILGANVFTGIQGLPAGTAALPSLYLGESTDGLFQKDSNTLGFTINGVEQGSIDSNGDLIIANNFQTSAGSGASPSITFTGNTNDGLYSKDANTIGISINGVDVGEINNSTGFKNNTGCNANYTRAGLLCLDTDGDLLKLVDASSSVGDTNVNEAILEVNAKYAILRVKCSILQDGTGEASSTELFIRPTTAGDQGQTEGFRVCFAQADIANERDFTFNEVTVLLDANGDFEYETNVTGTGTTHEMDIFLVGYYE